MITVRISFCSSRVRAEEIQMIKDFSHKGLENFFYDGSKKQINPKHARRLRRILNKLEKAVDVLKDMNCPGSNLHKLEPKKDERWKVKVQKNWGVIFIFKDGNAYEVDYKDIH